MIKSKKKIEIFFSGGTPVCRLGAHTLSHYTFFNGSDMVLYLCQISAYCVKWKFKSRGQKWYWFRYDFFPAFQVCFLGRIVYIKNASDVLFWHGAFCPHILNVSNNISESPYIHHTSILMLYNVARIHILIRNVY